MENMVKETLENTEVLADGVETAIEATKTVDTSALGVLGGIAAVGAIGYGLYRGGKYLIGKFAKKKVNTDTENAEDGDFREVPEEEEKSE